MLAIAAATGIMPQCLGSTPRQRVCRWHDRRYDSRQSRSLSLIIPILVGRKRGEDHLVPRSMAALVGYNDMERLDTSMQLGSKQWLMTLLLAGIASPALASIQGTYSGNFVTGIQSVSGEGTGAYSYVHTSSSAKKTANAGYGQYAGGNVIFAMANNDSFTFTVNDLNSNGLDDGDIIELALTVDLLRHDGSLNGTNTGALVATLSLTGNLTVGGTADSEHSSGFTNGIRNITSADTASSFQGVDYTIAVNQDFSIHGVDYFDGDEFTGDAYFQSGKLAGPFNGVSFDDTMDPDMITFAIWGDSRNMNGAGVSHNTGIFTPITGSVDNDHALGFDIFIKGNKLPGPNQNDIVPEASSVMVWCLLSCMGLVALRGRGNAFA